jgi:phospholipid transport system substrate-binding protein
MTLRPLRAFVALVFGVALFLSQVRSAFAGTATEYLKAKQTAYLELLKQSSPDQTKLNAISDEIFDYDTIARQSLGSEWDGRSDAEKAEFTALMKPIVRKWHELNMKKQLSYDIGTWSEAKKGDATIVTTKATSKTDARAQPIVTTYTMVDKGGSWKVVDVSIDGVSMVSSYRSQFVEIIKKDGFPKLIEKMKDKIAKGDI